MARRVFFHVGTLKTGTTYLQQVMWENRKALQKAGLLFAGQFHADRVAASETVRGMTPRTDQGKSAWDRIVADVNAFAGDAVISHELFGGATPEQAEAAKARLLDAEVHIIVTTRDLASVLPAFWQEQVKFGHAGKFADYDPLPLDASPAQHWSWRTIDAADVLRRWARDVPPERVHVITMPPAGSPRRMLWDRFAEVCGVDPAVATVDLPPVNESMGVVETELLRRFNTRLPAEIQPAHEIVRWVRTYMGLRILARRKGEKLRVPQARVPELRARSQRIADEIRDRHYHVVGDLADIVGTEDPPTSRQPEEVGDSELLEVALDTMGQMLVHHRALRRKHDKLLRQRSGGLGALGSPNGAWRRAATTARALVRRVRAKAA